MHHDAVAFPLGLALHLTCFSGDSAQGVFSSSHLHLPRFQPGSLVSAAVV